MTLTLVPKLKYRSVRVFDYQSSFYSFTEQSHTIEYLKNIFDTTLATENNTLTKP